MTKREAVFTKDLKNRKLTVVRSFDAPLEQVWDAWTQGDLLDLWWAPKPYRAITKTMDFREGGYWLYDMHSPQNISTWCKVDYKKIIPHKSIHTSAGFCDENGNKTGDVPAMHWKLDFNESNDETIVTVEITFDSESDLETIVKMGFQEGFTAGLNNLDEYLGK